MLRMVVVVMFSTAVFGQTWVEERTFVSGGQAIERVDGLISGNFTKKFGGFVWLQSQNGYGEGYGGPTFSPRPWVQLAAGAGVEQAKNPARVGGFVWLGNAKSSLLFIPEYGGSGFWWKLEASRKVSKPVSVGLLAERFKGTGPRLEFRIPKTRLALWAAPVFEKRRINALFGFRWYL